MLAQAQPALVSGAATRPQSIKREGERVGSGVVVPGKVADPRPPATKGGGSRRDKCAQGGKMRGWSKLRKQPKQADKIIAPEPGSVACERATEQKCNH